MDAIEQIVAVFSYVFAFFVQVRTKDRIFDSITHLINYHWTNALPIISEESALVLRKPVLMVSNNGGSGGGNSPSMNGK